MIIGQRVTTAAKTGTNTKFESMGAKDVFVSTVFKDELKTR